MSDSKRGQNTEEGKKGFQKTTAGKVAPKASWLSRFGKKIEVAEEASLSTREAIEAYSQLKQQSEDIKKAKVDKAEQDSIADEKLNELKDAYRKEALIISRFVEAEEKDLQKKYNLPDDYFKEYHEDPTLWYSYQNTELIKPVVYYNGIDYINKKNVKNLFGTTLYSIVLVQPSFGKEYYKYNLIPIINGSLDAISSYEVINKLVTATVHNIDDISKKETTMGRPEITFKVELEQDLACKKLLENGWKASKISNDDLNYVSFTKVL